MSDQNSDQGQTFDVSKSAGQDDTGQAMSSPVAVPSSGPAPDTSSSSMAPVKEDQAVYDAGASGWMPEIADDTDLIEKEWVDKAKEIVAQTANDPYLQNKEINKIRSEYLKKRYNKELKQSDE